MHAACDLSTPEAFFRSLTHAELNIHTISLLGVNSGYTEGLGRGCLGMAGSISPDVPALSDSLPNGKKVGIAESWSGDDSAGSHS